MVKADAYGHGAVEVSRVLVAEGHAAVGWLGDILLKSGARVVSHEIKPLLVANIAGGATQPLPVEFDTQIAAYLLNAALRSQPLHGLKSPFELAVGGTQSRLRINLELAREIGRREQ